MRRSGLFLPPRVGYIDLRVSRGSNGQQEQMLLVEVKCFPDKESTTRDLYPSIGQYLVYRAMAQDADLPFPLYLSVPESIFDTIFDPSVMRVMNESKMNIIVINLEKETIVRWIR
jgi:XisH protein